MIMAANSRKLRDVLVVRATLWSKIILIRWLAITIVPPNHGQREGRLSQSTMVYRLEAVQE